MPSELLSIHEPTGAVANVIFVHGIGGHPKTTWGNFDDQSWPGRLKTDLPNFNLFSLGYDAARSGWEGGHALPLQDRALNLLEVLRVKGILTKPTAFVMHSMGGLVIKQMFQTAETVGAIHQATFLNHLNLLVFVSTPHQGADIATWSKYFSFLARRTVAMQDLEAHAPLLRHLNEWFRARAERPDFPAVRVMYETLATPLHKKWWWTRAAKTLVVDPGSANPGLPGVLSIPIDANHNSILTDNVGYEIVLDALKTQLLGSKGRTPILPEAQYRQSILKMFNVPTFSGIVDNNDKDAPQGAVDMSVLNLFVDLEAEREIVMRSGPSLVVTARTGPAVSTEAAGQEPSYAIDTSTRENLEVDQTTTAQSQQKIERKDVLEFLWTHRSVVIRGGPGMGKSTLLRYLLALSALQQLNGDLKRTEADTNNVILPIMIPVRNYVRDSHENLLDFLVKQARDTFQMNFPADVLKAGFEQALQDGRCLVCVDGLDEIATDDQGQMIRNAITQWRTHYPQNRYVVTTRVAGYPSVRLDPTQFQLLDLLELDDEKIQIFLKNWFEIHLENPQDQKAHQDGLWESLKNQPAILKMARTPLLLTIIAVVYRQGTQLPSQRVRLYERCVELLLEKWGVRITQAEQDRPFFKLRERILRQVAWRMQQGEERLTIISSRLEREVQNLLATTMNVQEDLVADDAKAFLEFIEKRVGLLNDVGGNIFSFVHPTFQEYFTALYLYQNRKTDGIWEQIKDRLYDPKWREVILLLLGIPEDGDDENFTTGILEEIRRVGENDALEEYTHRHLDLRLAAVADLVAVTPEVKSRVIEETLQLLIHSVTAQPFQNHLARYELLERCREIPAVVDGLMQFVLDARFHPSHRVWAIQLLGRLGDKSHRVINGLLEIAHADTSDSDMQIHVAKALGALGEKLQAMAILSRVVQVNTNSNYIVWASEVFGSLGEKSHASKILLGVAKNTEIDFLTRVNALDSLGNLGEKPPEVIDGLSQIFNVDVYSQVKAAAIQALGKLGEKAQATKILFETAKKDISGEMGILAAQALDSFGEKPQAINILLETASSLGAVISPHNSAMKAQVAEALGVLGERSYAAEILLDIATTATYSTQESNLINLRTLGEKSPRILDGLHNIATTDPEPEVRVTAAQVFQTFGGNSREVISNLHAIATTKEFVKETRIRAAQVLADFGEKSQAIVSSLIKLAISDTEDRTQGHVRCRAIKTLGNYGAQSSADILLRIATKDTDAHVRIEAAKALEVLGYEEQAAAILFAITNMQIYYFVEHHAIHTLASFRNKALAVEALLEIARHNLETGFRLEAAKVLGTLGEKPQAARILLEIAKPKTDDYNKREAISALRDLAMDIAPIPKQ
jgi:HEAT repeat protein